MKEIIKTRWVWNEQTQEHEEVEYHTGKYKLDESDKIAIVSEYMQGQMSAAQIIEKYGIKSRQTLFSWMDKYVNEKELVSILMDFPNDSDRSWVIGHHFDSTV